jgi:hypothetical protein
MGLDDETRWETCALDAANAFASACRLLCDENPSQHAYPLAEIMTTALTELWDHRFSQDEICHAFMVAGEELPNYAAGEDRRA